MAGGMLERLGYTVLAASDPGEAVGMAAEYRRRDPPAHDRRGHARDERTRPGPEAIRSRRPDVGLLFMSGYTADVIAHRGILEPGTRFLQKPFSRTSLAAAVRDVLDG